MLFLASFWDGIRDGSITVTYRAWKRPQAKAGGKHCFQADGALLIDDVRRVAVGAIPAEDAAPAGFVDRDALVAALRTAARRQLADDDEVFRVQFRYVAERDPRLELGEQEPTAAELAELLRKLARSDQRSKVGPWTQATLQIIADRPATSARLLAPELGRERLPFKTDVRKLKKLGLTISLDVGYRLSRRGEAVLAALRG
jgi:hypothetical protein